MFVCGHPATAAQVDYRHNASTQVGDPFDPRVRTRDRGDRLHPHDLLDRLDIEGIKLVGEPEYHDVFLATLASVELREFIG